MDVRRRQLLVDADVRVAPGLDQPVHVSVVFDGEGGVAGRRAVDANDKNIDS